MNTKKIVVAGAGALGSHFVLLARNLDAEITVLDFDRVEQKNILSQFHGKVNLGKLKVESIRQTMNFLFGKKLQTKSSKLVEGNARELLFNSDLVVDALDNEQGRQIIQNYVRANNIPCLHGALAADGAFGRVCWDESFVIDSGAVQGSATCADGEELAFITLTASLLTLAAKEFLSSGKRKGYQIHTAGVILV